jgi:anti-sigma regulatory factor (Ser/Thr protein kinase)
MPEDMKRRLVIPNDTKYLNTVRDFVVEVVGNSAFPKIDMGRIVLAVDEAVTNIIEHAYSNKREGEVDIQLELQANATKFECIIHDSGIHFNMDNVSNPDMDEHVSEGKKNGLGIFLMRQIMDMVEYEFEEGVVNRLRMIKYVNPADKEGDASRKQDTPGT